MAQKHRAPRTTIIARFTGLDNEARDAFARRQAAREGRVYVSPVARQEGGAGQEDETSRPARDPVRFCLAYLEWPTADGCREVRRKLVLPAREGICIGTCAYVAERRA